MTKLMTRRAAAILAAAATLLGGCSTTPPAPPRQPQPDDGKLYIYRELLTRGGLGGHNADVYIDGIPVLRFGLAYGVHTVLSLPPGRHKLLLKFAWHVDWGRNPIETEFTIAPGERLFYRMQSWTTADGGLKQTVHWTLGEVTEATGMRGIAASKYEQAVAFGIAPAP